MAFDLDDEELKATRKLNGVDKTEYSVYAVKFAVMQKQIEEKDKEIEKLKNKVKDSISKQIIKDKIKELANTKGDLATYIAASERIKVLEEFLQEGEKDGIK